ncbi:MAG: hypothetical protein NTX03_08495 [Bacteroidetes bacterium]|nr:hypothetical protein [Bacteroidota bacterium]
MKKTSYILFIFTFFLFSCNNGQKKKDAILDKLKKEKLKKFFLDWQINEIAQHRFWAKDSCYMGWFGTHHFHEEGGLPWGFPDTSHRDTSQYRFSYADINNDGKTDQLVTFTPAQCDGGNASMWEQIEVLTISEGGKFKTTSSIGDGFFSYYGNDTNGFYHYDSIGVNKIYGTFYSFKKGDGHCCPSIVKSIIFDYKTKKIIKASLIIKK